MLPDGRHPELFSVRRSKLVKVEVRSLTVRVVLGVEDELTLRLETPYELHFEDIVSFVMRDCSPGYLQGQASFKVLRGSQGGDVGYAGREAS